MDEDAAEVVLRLLDQQAPRAAFDTAPDEAAAPPRPPCDAPSLQLDPEEADAGLGGMYSTRPGHL